MDSHSRASASHYELSVLSFYSTNFRNLWYNFAWVQEQGQPHYWRLKMVANGNKAVTCYLLMKRSNEQWLLSDWLFQATECWHMLLMCVILYLCDPVRAKYPITWIMAILFSVLIHIHNCFTATIQVNRCHLVTPVKNWRILLEQSFTICMSLRQ